ncbi:D-glycero-beta-D-manno-heptose 1-phosphate adenylyltransferase [Pedobacter yulinensis]|uniref:Bifunctional protein HldE n=1 Tax=Pedobacter yulinensis TaxID=2126353 RepID=A0A2T3HK43_9SPHI|nr:D-glycero-beta-D-manno-heptose 1-phosphate adenylyltransferase [Pedobacter yulinensis]PST82804.1 D-glycero-beta-D-manno-heptose 1-phosphate adenylyltransferase [Pedobacter yulinensis]
MKNLKEYLHNFAGLRLLVIGDVMLDVYVSGSCRRLAPEVSAPVLNAEDREYCLGGAANLAANVAALGATVSIAGVIGDDDAGRRIRAMLNQRGIDTDVLCMDEGRASITKTRFSSGGQTFLRLDEGCELPLDEQTAGHLSQVIAGVWSDYDGVILSDYGKGCLVPAVASKLAALQKYEHKFLAVDSKDATRFRDLRPALLKPNFDEAQALLGRPVTGNRAAELQAAGRELFDKTGAELIFLTLDEAGCLVFENGRFGTAIPAYPVERPQVSGAGDTFTGAVTLALLSGATPAEAADLAAKAAAVVLKKSGTACCAPGELLSLEAGEEKELSKKAILELLERERAAGKKIVFTNGCFDILHSGHVRYLQQARKLGDVLVVGLNRDDSIRRLKGSDRPVNKLADRLEVLSSLACVDFVIPFGSPKDDTPCALIRLVKPDIFVKGGDYKNAVLPEKAVLDQLGSRIAFIPVVNGRSTSAVIKKIAGTQLKSGWITGT